MKVRIEMEPSDDVSATEVRDALRWASAAVEIEYRRSRGHHIAFAMLGDAMRSGSVTDSPGTMPATLLSSAYPKGA